MLYNNVFLSDLDTLAVQLLPVKWRNPIHIAILKVFIHPFKQQFKRLKTERERNLYVLQHDARVGLLEKVLNDRFDFAQRRIRIGFGNRIQSLYLYTEAEAQQTYLPKTIYTQDEISARNTDFTVLVPADLIYNESEMNYLITYYADKDKQYKIEKV